MQIESTSTTTSTTPRVVTLYGVSYQMGTTLLELLIVLGIIFTVALLGFHHVFSLKSSSELRYLAIELSKILETARTASVVEQTPRAFCLSDDLKSCHASGRHWILFLDHDQDGDYTTSQDELIVSKAIDKPIVVSSNIRKGLVRFRSNGFGGATATSYYLCKPNLDSNFKVTVSLTGRTRIEKMLTTSDTKEKYCQTS